jgi:hypothetical protein
MIPSCRPFTVFLTLAFLTFAEPAARCQEDDHLSQLPAALADARFSAAFAVRNHVPSRYGSEIGVSFGEFTMRGPIVSTLRPIYAARAHVVFTSEGVFADRWRADASGTLFDWIKEANGRSPQRIESSVAYDSKRKHLACFDHDSYWYRYDVEKRRFVDRRKISGRPAYMVYDSDRDVMLGFGPSADGLSRMDIYSVDGELQESLEISRRLDEQTQPCAVWHRGYVVLIWPTTYSRDKPVTPGRIVALNAKNGEVVYRGDIRPSATTQSRSRGLFHRLTTKMIRPPLTTILPATNVGVRGSTQ